jgi:hypothetical protein
MSARYDRMTDAALEQLIETAFYIADEATAADETQTALASRAVRALEACGMVRVLEERNHRVGFEMLTWERMR